MEIAVKLWRSSLIIEIAVWLLRLQSDCWDCGLIAEIAVWLWRLQSDWQYQLMQSEMSWIIEISQRKANALNFFNPVLSTNQRPQFWDLNQCEASISGPPILTHFKNQTAISAIRLQSSFIDVWLCRLQFDCGDCSLIVKIAVKLWRLQSFYADCCLIVEIAVWLWRLPSGVSGMREISERKANAFNF